MCRARGCRRSFRNPFLRHMEEGLCFGRTVPKSSGCSRSMNAAGKSSAASAAAKEKSARLLPSLAFRRSTQRRVGNPSGYSNERMGRGPRLFHQGARLKVEQGGVNTTAKKSPLFILERNCSWTLGLERSTKGRTAISMASTLSGRP